MTDKEILFEQITKDLENKYRLYASVDIGELINCGKIILKVNFICFELKHFYDITDVLCNTNISYDNKFSYICHMIESSVIKIIKKTFDNSL